MILNLINPSDQITFVGDDVKVAGVATLMLGHGWYGLDTVNGERFVPLLMFDSSTAWLESHGISDLGAFIDANAIAIADFLDTAMYGSVMDRDGAETAMSMMSAANAAEYRSLWNDKRRTSLNDIGGCAARLAKSLRDRARGRKHAPLIGAPPIVFGVP